MKISLIEPRAADYHIYSAWAIPRQGLPLLGTILENKGHDVTIYQEDLAGFTPRKARDIVQSDLVGISVTTATAPRGYAIARLLQKRGLDVVFGGVHPTFMPEEPLDYADYCIQGEAEVSLPKLVDVLEKDGDLDEVPNLYYQDNGEVKKTDKKPRCLPMDDLPIPDYTLLEGHENLKIHPVMTTRGCPHDCTFCCVTPMFGRKYRMHSIDRVVDEVERLKGKHIFFCDDNFAVSSERAKKLLREMLRRDAIPSRWNTQVRADSYEDEELLELMRRTNCGRVFVGFESINQQVLDEYHKGQNLEDIKNCISTYHDYGISVHGMFMFGAEHDTVDSFQQTIGFAEEHGLDTAQFLLLTPVPGTQLFEKMDEQGRIFTYDWSLYDGHHVVFEPANMSPLQLQIESLKANRRFYSARSALRSLSKLKFGTAMLRYLGKRVVKKWHQKNSDFLSQLRGWQKGTTSFPRHYSLGRARPSNLELQ